MSEALQLLIQADGIEISHPQTETVVKFIRDGGTSFGEALADFCTKAGVSTNTALFFVAEELLFMKQIQLPLATQDLKEAISYQLGLLAPFPEDSILHSFTTHQEKEHYQVIVVAASMEQIITMLQETAEAGYRISGLFPESQRYVHWSLKKARWALVVPGSRFAKVIIFNGGRLEERIFSKLEPPFEELTALCGTEEIYHVEKQEDERFLDTQQLKGKKPLLRDFNMLPASFVRTDFSRMAVIALIVLNVIALLAFVGGKMHYQSMHSELVEQEITKIMPQVKEVKDLQAREMKLREYVESIEGIGRNPDIILFVKQLTDALPETSYLDQMRMDKKQNAIHIQGYTDDIGSLTAALQEMGEAKLKSTSRRKSKTYFNVEINLP